MSSIVSHNNLPTQPQSAWKQQIEGIKIADGEATSNAVPWQAWRHGLIKMASATGLSVEVRGKPADPWVELDGVTITPVANKWKEIPETGGLFNAPEIRFKRSGTSGEETIDLIMSTN